MDISEQRERWVDCMVISVCVTVIFLLILTPFFSNWMICQIPHIGYRTMTAGFIILGATFIISALVLVKRDNQWHCRHRWWSLYNERA